MQKTNSFRALFVLPVLIFLSGFLTAQTGVDVPGMGGVDAKMLQFMKDWNISGGSVAFARDGKLIYNKGFGHADRRGKIPVTPEHKFRIASVSKPITSIAVMKLVEEGKLSLNSKVFGTEGILNDPYYNEVIDDNRIFDITVQQLLEHTAGWDRREPYGRYDHSDAPFFPLHVTEMEGEANPVGDSTLIRFSLANGLHFEPGSKFSYSNVGYLVLGKVVARLGGMPYEQYVKTEVFDPAGAHNTELGRNLRKNKLDHEVDYISRNRSISCYGDGKTVAAPYGGFNLEAMNAHGGWVSTTADLVRILLAVDGDNSREDLLSPETIRTMMRGGEKNRYYAKGWSVNSQNNAWHTGSLDGTAAFVGKTGDGYTWAILFNSRANNSSEFWSALDELPWACLNTVIKFPAVDLFQSEQLFHASNKTSAMNLSASSSYGLHVVTDAQQTAEESVPYTGIPMYTAGRIAGSGTEETSVWAELITKQTVGGHSGEFRKPGQA